MFLSSLQLAGFRSYARSRWDFSEMTTVMVGPNAVGKTNVLEAIYLLASGDSFRAGKIEEMVSWGAEVGHVVGVVEQDELAVVLTRGVVQGKRVQKRGFKINGVGRRKNDFAGMLKAVVFLPEDLDLMNGTPTLRRRFLDETLSQVSAEYRRSFATYEQALRRRNRILDAIADGRASRAALAFWDQTLIKHGQVLTEKRRELVAFMNESSSLAAEDMRLRVAYEPSTISEKRLVQYEREEVAAKHTLVGPHRDDFRVMHEERDLAVYGSRGEQRMGVLWLKMCELEYIRLQTGEAPLLLLDDIFSELDEKHEAVVTRLLGNQQTLITTTEVHGLLLKLRGIAEVRLG